MLIVTVLYRTLEVYPGLSQLQYPVVVLGVVEVDHNGLQVAQDIPLLHVAHDLGQA